MATRKTGLLTKVLLVVALLWLFGRFLMKAGASVFGEKFPTEARASKHFTWTELSTLNSSLLPYDADKKLTADGLDMLTVARFAEDVRLAFGELPIVVNFIGSADTPGVGRNLVFNLRPLSPGTGGKESVIAALTEAWKGKGGPGEGGFNTLEMNVEDDGRAVVTMLPAEAIRAHYQVR